MSGGRLLSDDGVDLTGAYLLETLGYDTTCYVMYLLRGELLLD